MGRYVYAGRPGNKRQAKPKRRACTRPPKKSYKLIGGPWGGHRVYLSDGHMLAGLSCLTGGSYQLTGARELQWTE